MDSPINNNSASRQSQEESGESTDVVNKRYTCSDCDKIFTNLGSLKLHVKIHTREKLFTCDQCNKEFTQKGHLTEHMRVHTGVRPYACKVCNKMFTCSSNLSKHSRIHTRDSVRKPQRGRIQRIEKSSKQKHREKHVKSHSSPHSSEAKVRHFNCTKCFESFQTKSLLFSHKKTHADEKPFACGQCNKKYMTESGLLEIHSRVHTGEKPIVCIKCNKQFKHLQSLEEHSRCHNTKKKSFKCTIKKCGKKLSSKAELRRHTILHSGEKPFVCFQCNKRFAVHWYVIRHMKNKHPEDKSTIQCKTETT